MAAWQVERVNESPMAEHQALSRRELLRAGFGVGAALLGAEVLDLATRASDSQASALSSAENTSEIEKYLPRSHFIRQGPADRRNVAITVDDFSGIESITYLNEVMDIGRRHGVHFTFFPIGQAQLESFGVQPTKTRQAWQRALAEGHVIGNHTFDHKLLGAMSRAGIIWELGEQAKAMNHVLGFNNRELLMRPPGGSGGFDSPSLRGQYIHTLSTVKELGYYMTMWTVDSNAPDGSVVTPREDQRFLDKIFHDPVEQVQNGSIILVHPNTLSVSGMSKLVAGLRERHYNMVSVPELFEPRK